MENKKFGRNVIIAAVCGAIVLLLAAFAIVAGLMGRTQIMDRNQALDHALSDAGLAASDITLIRQELERDHGRDRYEIEFRSGEHAYSYEIDASNGAIEGVSIMALNDQSVSASSRPDREEGGQEDGQSGQEPSQAVETEDRQGQESGQPGTDGQEPSQAVGTEGRQGQESGQQNQPPQSGQQGQPSGPVETMDDAKATALEDAGLAEADVTFVKEKLDWDDGIAVYDIKFYSADTEYEYEIDATTGAIIEKSAELLGSQGTGIGGGPSGADSYISVEDAKEIAAVHAGFGTSDVFFTKAKLELEHGRAEYEIEFYQNRIEYEYTIDAITGDILEFESEYDD